MYTTEVVVVVEEEVPKSQDTVCISGAGKYGI